MLYGCAFDVALDLIAREKDDELLKRILEKYKTLEEHGDFIVCAGTDFRSPSSAREFDINVKIANNLGCAVLPVVKGNGKGAQEVVGAAVGLVESLRERNCDLLALIANRVEPRHVDGVAEALKRMLPEGVSSCVLPELPILGKPTVGEVADGLGAKRLAGDAESFSREVGGFHIAASELPACLDRVEEGSLVIASGDRSDILVGSLLAAASGAFPRVAGIVLVGGFEPAPQVRRLMEGSRGGSPVPVISVPADAYSTAVGVSSMEGAITHDNARKIAAALGNFEANVDSAGLLARFASRHAARVTPILFEYEIIRRAKSRRKHIVLPEGTEERILRAAEILRMRDVVDITLLGDAEEILRKSSALGISLPGVRFADPVKSPRREAYAREYFELRRHKNVSEQMAFDAVSDVSYFGTMMVHFGEADGMVSGSVHTTQHTIRPALEIIRTRPGCSIVSSVFFMCLADHVLVFGDCAVNPEPGPGQLADIAASSADTARAFGIEPLVAMLSYSTGDSGKGAGVDKVREAVRIAKERRPDLKIEGPIQYDAAVDAGVARTKLPGAKSRGGPPC
jgi:phosphate acetyltransferase